ncbi:Soluble lytic murein transglycosylase [Fervidicola ferrireducens]|uniref:Soluble lytic murein transglycosylase n=1 Tax=Fervidicola ferrireducens TaxID=520764 RepID=A0A140LE81_9FIRM|nr:lytic transglycosylase domain-containing protein [Fervidicola ferrireducens]KXG78856.1 Soluble lytic murein transglycosylase [Fervidicola ferrireducens]
MERFTTRNIAIVVLILVGLFSLYSNVLWFLRYLYPLKYGEYILRYADEYGVDPYLVAAVIKVESNFSPEAVSPKGAMGLMQIMPDTARWAAEQMGIENLKAEEIFNPEVNIRIGTWYLAGLIEEFKDTDLALAAYNGGRGNVREWIKSGIFDKKKNPNFIPFEETRRFVQKVKKAYFWYRKLYEFKTKS